MEEESYTTDLPDEELSNWTGLSTNCQDGIILPVWTPQEDLSVLEVVGRGIVYFLCLMYMFVGVSIISDRFMGAIEVITSKQRKIKIKRSNGTNQTVVVRVWNETVANLTLMALGSSAPEILLTIIEIIGKNFEAGELGPGTIVGSAAFNFLVIVAICIIVIPTGEVRKIKHLPVFFVTSIWSLFAYLWLLVILKWSSPGVVEIWESAVTSVFFIATVITAYIADRNLIKISKLRKTYRLNKRGVIVEGEANTELGMLANAPPPPDDDDDDADLAEFERQRAEYIQLLKELRRRYPHVSMDALETLARAELMAKSVKSRAFYRIQATRRFSGQDIMSKFKKPDGYTLVPSADGFHIDQDHVTRIYFNPSNYSVMENAGTVKVTVARSGGRMNETVLVDYETEDGTATANQDYVPASGTLTFGPDETKKEITVKVIDDEVFEQDERFYIRLAKARFEHGRQKIAGVAGMRKGIVKLDIPFRATVKILDDDHSGIFGMAETETETTEAVGTFDVKVIRASGARGKVIVPYKMLPGSAKPGKDYQHVEGKLKFENNETEKVVAIPIIDENSYEKDVSCFLELSTPVPLDAKDNPLTFREKKDYMSKEEKIALDGWPKLGSDTRAQIRIKESSTFRDTVDKLLQRDNTSVLVGTNTWKEQFVEAVSVTGGEEENGRPSCGAYLLHILTVFWKILFAFIPPTSICDGYLTFIVSILGIGVLTAFIGDLASHLGCTVGLRDSVTAITLVALGTSVPDMFASKVAAVQDQYADASIGNVTGSNAVNVFLGIGIAWTIAAVVKAYRTCAPDMPDCNVFRVDPGSLAFSVSVFCACAVVGIFVLVIRRLRVFGGGELGGPAKYRYPTAVFFIFLWILYIVLSSLEAYGVIPGF